MPFTSHLLHPTVEKQSRSHLVIRHVLQIPVQLHPQILVRRIDNEAPALIPLHVGSDQLRSLRRVRP